MLEKPDRKLSTACCMALTDIPEGDKEKTAARIRFACEEALADGYLYWGVCITGKEYEYMVADFLLKRRNTPGSPYQNRIKLILILPGRNYISHISEEAQKRLKELCKAADKTTFASEDCQASGAYAKCAELLLSQSSFLLTLCRGTMSFAGRYLVKPAFEQGLKVRNCCQWDIRIIQRKTAIFRRFSSHSS